MRRGDGVRGRRLAWLGLCAVVSLPGLACREPGGGTLAGSLGEHVATGRFAIGGPGAEGLSFPRRPALASVGAGGEHRDAVVAPVGSWWWRGRVPAEARLAGAAQRVGGGRLRVTVSAVRPLERQVLARAQGDAGWLPFAADLSHLAGEHLALEIRSETDGAAPAAVAWSPFAIETGQSAAREQRPNVVLILVDTLRADRLSSYGAERPTSPNLEALLARRGVVAERAYAQAPWTLPSVAALMSSRWPGEVIGSDVASFGLPESVPALATVLQGLGYETAGFFGNPGLHAANGFTRGFSSFYVPDDLHRAMNEQHADDLTSRIRGWLTSQRARPFFLYAHFIDPHDPYDNPDVVEGRSPFYRAYTGTLSGRWIHGVFLGKIPLRDPASDVRHLAALYDSEIRYFDRHLGRLLSAFDRQTLGQTLFVFTSDHGEELYDHGGWKHGRTLYEEQLRVPLVFRWDGKLPAGRRVAHPVRLMDVAPTVVAAAGGTPPPEWQGRNLLPLLRGEQRGMPYPLYARHYLDGPVRASALVRGWKLVLFDRRQEFTPANQHQALLYAQEMRRLERVELYDLRRDPGERRNLAAAHPEVVARLSPVVHEHLGRELPGVRLLLAGVPAGERVELEVRLEGPADWSSYFLAAGDAVEATPRGLRLRLTGEALAKGIRLAPGARIADLAISSRQPVTVRLGSGVPYRGGAVPAESLSASRWPGLGDRPAVLLWEPPPAAAPPRPPDAETARRLKALGYAG